MSANPGVKQWCRRAKALTRKLRWIQREIEEMSNDYPTMRDEYYEPHDKEMVDKCYATLFRQHNALSTSNIMSGGSRSSKRKTRRRHS
jgi:hypothetical protein